MKLNKELAEILGIHVGDGYLRYLGKRKEIDVSGNYNEEAYYNTHVVPLFSKYFKIKIFPKKFPSRKTYGFVVRDKKVINLFKKMEFPSGKKSLTIKIPKEVLSSKEKSILTSFLRGYFDTDGCLTFTNANGKGEGYSQYKKTYHYYPRIILRTVSPQVFKEVCYLLDILNFRYSQRKRVSKNKKWNDAYEIYISGKKEVNKWMKEIGSKNITKYSRYLIWKLYGFCPTNISFDQRINILEGRVDPYSLYGPVV